ncbi:MAG: hypothetical protein Q8O62_09905 [Aequorivita sp.]|nr:hypothetical protein [Aequorivita sp.]
MEKLKNFQEILKSRPAFQLDVMDCVTEKVFQKAVNQVYLDKNHNGSLPAYLQAMHVKGLQKILLTPKLKNGNSSKPFGAPITVDFTEGSPPAQNGVTSAPVPQQMPVYPAGLNGAFGLGMPEIMDGFAAKRELEIWKMNCAKFEKLFEDEKEKRKKLTDKVSELLRENDKYSWEQTTEKEPSKFDKIIDGIFANPSQTIPALMGAIAQFKGGGLNAPNTQNAQIVDPLEGYSDMQRALCDMVGQCPDSFCEELATLISRVAEPDQSFIKELKKLLETPNLKKVQNG